MRPFILSFVFGLMAACALPATGPLAAAGVPAPLPFAVFSGGLYGLFWLFLSLPSGTRLTAFGYGYAWAFGYFLLSLAWIGNALLIDGNPYAWAYPLALVGLPLLLSFFLGMACTLAAPLFDGAHPTRTAIVLIATFSLAEIARGHLLTGFPWNLPAFVWSDTLPVFQILSLIGPYGLTTLTLLWALAVPMVVMPPFCRMRGLTAFAALTLGLTLIYGYVQLHTPLAPAAKQIQIVMVQSNIPQSEKWDGTKMIDHFYDHIERSRANAATFPKIPTMIVWPETALPPAYIDAPAVRRAMASVLLGYPKGSWLITGALRADDHKDPPAFYNAMLAYDAQGNMIPLYDKHHLVPFGEYIPFQKWIPIGPVTQFENLMPGDGPKTISLPGLPPFAPLICYEVIFANEVRAAGPPSPRLIVNVTNDSWYGDTAGPHQHLAQARARAIEQGLPLIRVAGTGISAALDSYGRVQAEIPYNTDGSRTVLLAYENRKTPLYQLYGDLPFLFLAIVVLFTIVLNRRN